MRRPCYVPVRKRNGAPASNNGGNDVVEPLVFLDGIIEPQSWPQADVKVVNGLDCLD